MHRNLSRLGFIAAALVAGITPLQADTQTGTFSVTVKGAGGAPLAGVRIELRSDKLIGVRTGMTDASGAWKAPLLPPGSYTAVLSKQGFIGANVYARVEMGSTANAEATLKTAESASAIVEVVGTQTKLDKSDVSIKENFKQDEILALPVGRTLDGITQLSPGVTVGAGGRTAIAGSATYENKFLVNGTDINDPYFNTGVPLFIEDAIDETQVLAHNVSAEYGGFTGGVVNAITRRGGNDFAGTFRANMTNAAWNAMLPFQDRSSIKSKVNTIYTATFGGPILKDKLWFFTAVRRTDAVYPRILNFTGVDYSNTQKELRYEVNLSYQVNQDNRVGVDYTARSFENINRAALISNTADPNALSNRKDPYSIIAWTWDSIFSPSFNMNVTYSRKLQKLTSTRKNPGTAFWNSPTFGLLGELFNQKYFSDTDETRDNANLKVTFANYFEALGSHELKYGYDHFEEKNNADNGQSPTGYVIDASWANYGYGAAYNGVTFDFDAYSYLEDWTKAPGGVFKSKTDSFFINDNWTLSKNLNASIGFRYDMWKGDKKAGYIGPDISTMVPRLGLNYDVNADGVWQIFATHAQYAGKVNTGIAQAGTYVGNPAVYYYAYTGPDAFGVAAGPNSLGFRRSDYSNTPYFVSDPALTTVIDKNLKAPLTFEYTLGLKHKTSATGVVTFKYTYRNMTRMFEDYQGLDGIWTSPAGDRYSITRWGNVRGANAARTYRALETTFADSMELAGGKLSYQGNITLSRLWGNYDGDGGNSVGGGTQIGNFPGQTVDEAPYGLLPNDEPVAIKVFGAWTRAFGANTLTLGFNASYTSGHPYSLTKRQYYGHIDPTTGDFVVDNGATYPDDTGYYMRYFGGRGTGRFNDTLLADFSAQWDGRFDKRYGYFVKFTAFNVLNHIQQATWDTSFGRPSGYRATNVWTAGPNFGKALTSANYVGARNLQLELGFKF